MLEPHGEPVAPCLARATALLQDRIDEVSDDSDVNLTPRE